MRQLLEDTYAITRLGFNWDVRRRDSPMFNDSKVGISLDLTIKIRLWESSSGELYSVVFPQGPVFPFHCPSQSQGAGRRNAGLGRGPPS